MAREEIKEIIGEKFKEFTWELILGAVDFLSLEWFIFMEWRRDKA